jgi:glycosyltransferase involved in cell wall biosynthesis
MPKHVLILSYSDLSRDARVLRQINELRQSYSVSTGARVASGVETGLFIRMLPEETFHLGFPIFFRKAYSAFIIGRTTLMRKLGAQERIYWTPYRKRTLAALAKVPADLIIANDIDTLPLAIRLAGQSERQPKVVFDAHEFSPGQHEGDAQWMKLVQPLNVHLCKTYMPQADRCFTVSPSIAEAYQKLTGVRPSLLTNAPHYVDQPPASHHSCIVELVHHGGASPERQTLQLVEMMDLLGPGFRLNLFLVSSDQAYLQKVRIACSERPNVIYNDPLPPEEIISTIHGFDIGIHLLPPTSFNHIHALPNKLFEFIQARLAIAVSPSPAMARLVTENKLGVVAEDYSFEALARAIHSMDRQRIADCKRSANDCARALSAEGNMTLLRQTVSKLLG